MRYLTSRKQAEGLGSAKTGTHHHWQMQVKGMALVFLIPLFIFTFGPMLGRPMRKSPPITRAPSRRSSRA